ncbi:hypothetical protein EAE96_008405 [Botrytis aclada]|nr:hypothetical protein EAE96_008405 [Botrytis aclada]
MMKPGKRDYYRTTLSEYENTLLEMSHAEEDMEAAWNELEERKIVGDQDEASAARIKDSLAGEQGDAATTVGEVYSLILLDDKSIEHIKSLSPLTMRLLNNAEPLTLRKHIIYFQEQLKNSVKVPEILPEREETCHSLSDKM